MNLPPRVVRKKLRWPELWVVYQAAVRGQATGPNAVCGQDEWDEMERAHPGQNRLIKSGITSEGEAERLARGTSGDPIPRVAGGRAITPP